MSDTCARTLGRIAEAVRTAAPGIVVNVVGPLGVGKSALMSRAVDLVAPMRLILPVDLAPMPEPPPTGGAFRVAGRHALRRALASAAALGRAAVAVDGVDSDAAAGDLLAELTAAAFEPVPPEPVPAPPGVPGQGRTPGAVTIVVASRRPLLARPGWPGGLVTVTVDPWSDGEIGELAGRLGIADPHRREVVVRLAGGIPLIAETLCRALHRGIAAELPGALADQVVQEVRRRLTRESSAPGLVESLGGLASIGQGDEELLGPEAFARLGELSIVVPGACGLAVEEPYRTLFELAHRWRAPLTHRARVTAALAHHRQLPAAIAGDPGLGAVVERFLFLSSEPGLRDALFPPRREETSIRPATEADADDVGLLVHRWARRGGLDVRRCERVVGPWLEAAPEGFHLIRDRDDRALGVMTLLPVSARTAGVIEPLLERHTEELTAAGGVFIGMGVCDESRPGAHAALLRHTMAVGVASGHMVVSTWWPPYQRLVGALGFRHHGDTADDVYGSGRPCQIHARPFAGDQLPEWIDRLTGPGVQAPPERRWLAAQVRRALEQLHDAAALARSPLLPLFGDQGVGSLREWLHAAVEEMSAAAAPEEAEAGEILRRCYVRRRGGHTVIAHQMHLSRATYYRRLNRALTMLAERLPTR
ncbi:hypothetical protein [Microbispora triticiradicis]|uniref:hypothetical protein n=1 Tax=Microbispora triticiradicis TaxID=2200763 RepID=UPI001AD7B68F|nr:hypothetical protein [Microbispora triticiradicis]MBO4273751.1 hypothetical protein [Microbispora triticiradicis]